MVFGVEIPGRNELKSFFEKEALKWSHEAGECSMIIEHFNFAYETANGPQYGLYVGQTAYAVYQSTNSRQRMRFSDSF